MKILITGDILPQSSNNALFEQGNSAKLLGDELTKLFEEADFRIGNLEGPLTDADRGIDKSGPNLKAGISAVHGLKRMGFDGFGIANNHIMDFGVEGYDSTIKALDAADILHVGADKNAQAARKPLIVEIDGMKIGFYACAEYEFTIATDNTPGANAFDAFYCFDDICGFKEQVDYLVVLYHGSKEYYRYPVPYVQRRCRRMVEKGADLVLCQHSHCIGCFEKWGENGQILYGQGNFLFDIVDNEYTNTGLLVGIEYSDQRWETSYIPIIKTGNAVRMAEGDESEEILTPFMLRSEQIKQDGFIEEEYRRFADKYMTHYLNLFMMRFSIIPRILEKIGFSGVYKCTIKKKHKLNMLNSLRCEAHRDLFIHGLENNL